MHKILYDRGDPEINSKVNGDRIRILIQSTETVENKPKQLLDLTRTVLVADAQRDIQV